MIAPLMSSTRMSPTPAELATGRFMRAPDGHDGGDPDPGAAAAADKGGSDASSADQGGSDNQSGAAKSDDSSLLGGATDPGAGGAGKDGDGEVQDGDGDKSADGDGADADADKSKDDPDNQIPEAYSLEPIKVGEGDAAQTVEIDTKLLTDVTPLLKEAGVTQGNLAKLAPAVIKVQEQLYASLNDDHAAMKADWEKTARADKDIGGNKMDETLALAARALDSFGAKSVKDKDGNETNEFRALLNDTGLGNHPVLLKMFREIGKLVGEDGDLIRPDVSPAGKQDRLEILYPNDVPKK